MSKYIILSLFSFFESYFKSVLEELIDFHGGKDSLIDYISKKQKIFISLNSSIIKKSKRKLQEPEIKSKKQKYEKYSQILSKQCEFRFPSELFALYGTKCFFNSIHESNFKSVMIPDILKDIFHMDLSDKVNTHSGLKNMDLEQTFDSMRDIRNKIAHGEEININIKKIAAYSDFIRIFSIKIDKHLVTNFFILQKDI